MNAIVQTGYGPPREVLRMQEIEPPELKAGDVLVRVRATSVNTPDWITVTGVPYVLRLTSGPRRPRSPVRGTDVAGVVEAVAPDVADLQPGDEVFGSSWTGPRTTRGTFAELTALPASSLIRKPEGLSFEDAAASVMSGLTAMTAMQASGKVTRGTRVLINGASGGVGTFAVQMARSLGAEVTGVCSARNFDLVKSLGADHVIDYTREDFTRDGQRYDVVLDNVLNHPPSATARALAPGGVLMPNSVGNTGGVFAGLPRMARAALMRLGPKNVQFVNWKVERENLTALAALLRSGDARVVIAETYSLADAAEAVAHMAGHHAVGKVAIAV
jgi:NADPH:quinone reductase-like Zn-dependent oxidoreductase